MSTRLLTLLALLFAMLFPTVAAWSYFLGLAVSSGGVNPRQQAAYVLGKFIQFSFPLAFLIFLGWRARKRSRRWHPYAQHAPIAGLPPAAKDWEVSLDSGWRDSRGHQLYRPHFAGRKPAVIFGLVVMATMIAVYFGALRGTSVLAQTPVTLRHKLQEVNVDTPQRYLVLAVFIVAVHSLLEEYYWRWFVFGGLRQFLALLPAMLLSSLAFMAHHMVVLYVYLPGRFWTAALPLSLAIAVGGGVWAWLYERSGNIWAPWISHLLVDAGIFVIGWDLLWPLAT